MTLSASTLALFALLVPGFVFRIALYHNAVVQRPFWGTNAVLSAILVLLFSITIQFAQVLLLWLADRGLAEFGAQYVLPHPIIHFGELKIQWLDRAPEPIVSFLLGNPWSLAAYVLLSILIAWFSGRLLQPHLEKYPGGGRMLYGPLSELYNNGDLPLFKAFVLTKITHDGSTIMYRGLVSELSLGEGNDVRHIILTNPEKYLLVIGKNRAATTKLLARALSANSMSLLCIDGSDIANVHFEPVYFAVDEAVQH